MDLYDTKRKQRQREKESKTVHKRRFMIDFHDMPPLSLVVSVLYQQYSMDFFKKLLIK